MLSIPLPLVTLLVLLILMLTLWIGDRQRYRFVLLFLLACSLLITVGMLRWIWPSPLLMLVRVLIATLLPALAWHCFSRLTQRPSSRWQIAPAILAIIIMQCWSSVIDSVLFLLYLAYGVALINVSWRGSDKFTEVRLSEASTAAKMAFAAGIFLCFSGLTDLLVALEFAWHQGMYAPQLIAVLQTLMLPFLALAIAFAAHTRPSEDRAVESLPILAEVQTAEQALLCLQLEHGAVQSLPILAEVQSPEQAALCLQLEQRLRKDDLFLDSNLTLNLLARKAGIPARHISRAINATYHCNVSQWINGFRIRHAQQLLSSSSLPVTEVMLASGFTTKSNFNREFMRISGLTPSAFRQQANPAKPPEMP